MKLISWLSIPVLALAGHSISLGTFHLYGSDGSSISRSLEVDKNMLIASELMSTFDYADSGALELFYTKTYLSIDASRKLTVEGLPEIGFRLVGDVKLGSKYILFYKDDSVFELCDDNSIGYKSGCEGARNVTIMYEEIFTRKRTI